MCLVLLCCLALQSALPVTLLAQAPDALCTKADVDSALGDAPSCDSSGAVFFGSNVVSFVSAQCQAVAVPGQSGSSVKTSIEACVRCARKAWNAYKSAAEAKLIPGGAKPTQQSISKIKRLCGITDDPNDSSGGANQPPQDGALGNVYSQLQLCLPKDGQSVDVSSCVSCANAVLSNALSSGAIPQQKYDVMSKSVQQVCNHQPSNEPTPSATPGGHEPGPTPEPSPTPNPARAAFTSAVVSCINTNLQLLPPNREACVSCVNAVPHDGLESDYVSKIVQYAVGVCQGSTLPPK